MRSALSRRSDMCANSLEPSNLSLSTRKVDVCTMVRPAIFYTDRTSSSIAILYRVVEDGVLIGRVFHGARGETLDE